jgi:hypothetical protein
MTEGNCKRPNHSGRAVIRDQFIIWIEPGVVGKIQTGASPLRAGEMLAGDRLERIFGDLINALLQSDSFEGVETLELL